MKWFFLSVFVLFTSLYAMQEEPNTMHSKKTIDPEDEWWKNKVVEINQKKDEYSKEEWQSFFEDNFRQIKRRSIMAILASEVSQIIDLNVLIRLDPAHSLENQCQSPLIIAITHWWLDVIEELLALGVDPNQVDSEGIPPLGHATGLAAPIRALQQQKVIIVGCLLGVQGIEIDKKDFQKRTPLYRAVMQGDEEGVVEKLVALKADLNAKSIIGITPLMLAMCL